MSNSSLSTRLLSHPIISIKCNSVYFQNRIIHYESYKTETLSKSEPAGERPIQ